MGHCDTVVVDRDTVDACSTPQRQHTSVYGQALNHELRTLLTPIVGITELMLEGAAGELTDQQWQLLATVQRSGLRLVDAVGQVLSSLEMDATQR